MGDLPCAMAVGTLRPGGAWSDACAFTDRTSLHHWNLDLCFCPECSFFKTDGQVVPEILPGLGVEAAPSSSTRTESKKILEDIAET